MRVYYTSNLANKKTGVVVVFLVVIFTGKLYKKDPQQHQEVKRLLVFLLERHVSKLFLVLLSVT